MDRAPIPDDVSRFILLAIPSVPYLEAVLLLRRHTSEPWDCRRVAERLYVSEKTAQALLTELHGNGLVDVVDEHQSHYVYHPQTDDLRQMIDRLAAIHSTNLVGVTNLIHSKINKKAQQFADAFIWRKDS